MGPEEIDSTTFIVWKVGVDTTCAGRRYFYLFFFFHFNYPLSGIFEKKKKYRIESWEKGARDPVRREHPVFALFLLRLWPSPPAGRPTARIFLTSLPPSSLPRETVRALCTRCVIKYEMRRRRVSRLGNIRENSGRTWNSERFNYVSSEKRRGYVLRTYTYTPRAYISIIKTIIIIIIRTRTAASVVRRVRSLLRYYLLKPCTRRNRDFGMRKNSNFHIKTAF